MADSFSAPMHLPDWLARRAATAPRAPALIAEGREISFAELDALASALAASLRAAGLQPGDRVALLAGNSPAFAAVVHAAPRCGAILVPLNTRLAPAELAWQLGDVGARLLLYDELNEALARAAGDLIPTVTLAPLPKPPPSRGEGLDSDQEAESPPSLLVGEGGRGEEGAGTSGRSSSFILHPSSFILDQPHTIIYTSGTTGRPKGAILTYGNHWWSATASALNLGLHADDRWLAVLPLFHVGGLSILMRGVIYGIPVVLHERFDPAAVNAAIDGQRVTIISVVATMLQRMLDARGDRPYPAHLRCVLLGGGPAPRPLLEACAARGVPVVQTYGMTETASQAVTLAPADALRKLGSAGQPLLPIALRVDAEPGSVGEILLRGPMVTPGYYGRPEATAAAIRDGWLHTGDLGYLDDEGYLYVVDRRSDLIIAGGENIYPAEVEAVLLAHPAVAEAGVVGAPDPAWGQVPVAYVVLRATGQAEELIAFCRTRLAGYKVPRRITVVDELPRTAAGKLRRNLLRER